MQHKYLLLAVLLLGLAGPRANGQSTTWRPFRPGLVYSFAQAGAAATYPVHTLRVDSAYATASGDSVFSFNRLLRLQPGSTASYLKSRNNLFGARLRWQPGTSDYYLEVNAEPALGGPATPVALLLRPRVAVGSTWTASAQPALTATLSSRTVSTGSTTTDSVAVITLSNGQQLTLSRRFGLLQGPPWLTLATGSTSLLANWAQAALPQAGLGSYDPRVLFALAAGDELGESLSADYLNPWTCQTGYRLRRILSRQQTPDSLIFTYQEQQRITNSGFPGCGGVAGTTTGARWQGRWAFSLRTGASPQFPGLGLLVGEYRAAKQSGVPGTLVMGQSYMMRPGTGNCLDNTKSISYVYVYPSATSTTYHYGIDFMAFSQTFSAALGLGISSAFEATSDSHLTYYRRGSTVCGEPANFAGLLPTRAALAAHAGTLFPNPATTVATLSLAEPAQQGTTLALTDALGRRVWSAPLAAGQTSLAVPLAAQPAGIYLLQLTAPNTTPLTWKLLKQDF